MKLAVIGASLAVFALIGALLHLRQEILEPGVSAKHQVTGDNTGSTSPSSRAIEMQVGREATRSRAGQTQCTGTDAHGSGFELPLPPGPVLSKFSAPQLDEKDPYELCLSLRRAIDSGDGHLISMCRDKLLRCDAEAVNSLHHLLRCGETAAETEALRLLLQIGTQDALTYALARILVEPRGTKSYAAFLDAFAYNRSEDVAQYLAAAMGETRDSAARDHMADLLRAMCGSEVVNALAASALQPASPKHRADSLALLAVRQDPNECGALVGLLDSEDAGLRESAALGLAHVGTADACMALAANGGDEACLSALYTVTVSYSQETLLRIATEEGLPTEARRAALAALASQSGDRVGVVLINAAGNEDSSGLENDMTAVGEFLQEANVLEDWGSVSGEQVF